MIKTSQPATSSKNKRIVFFGNERLVSGLKHTDAPILHGLIRQGYNVVAIVSHHTEGKSRNNRELEVAAIAKTHAIPLFLPENPSDILSTLRDLQADIGILVAYGRIISQEVIDTFPLGIINIHPSLLPRYRGPTPIESAILNGDTETGVSIMQLSRGMDDGPIYAQEVISLKGTETKIDLYNKIVDLSERLFFEILPSILDGSSQPHPQDRTEVTYSQLFKKSNGMLEPSSLTALEAERRIRAYTGFPKTKLTILNHSAIITKAHITTEKKTPLDVEFRDGAYISIDELIGPSGKTMTKEAFLNGYAAGA
mgnify:CR=1 FL=1